MQESFRVCRLCARLWDGPALKLGRLPVCNRFEQKATEPDLWELSLDQCPTCGLVQLRDLPPVSSIVPRLPWISYREPEAHLDDVVARVKARFGITDILARGVGPFEEPLLDRLARLGAAVEQVEPPDVGDRSGLYPYLETWQQRLAATALQPSADCGRRPDIVSCRYLIEHAHDPIAALQALGASLRPGGLLLVEVPDSSKFLAAKDYCFLWEEHVSYFTELTVFQLAARAGFEVVELMRFEGRLEDALVVLLKQAADPPPAATADAGEIEVYSRYRNGYAVACSSVHAALGERGDHPGKVALFGLGHQAIMFANAFGVSSAIAVAVDDDAQKRGLFAPGLRVPVVSSAELVGNRKVDLCLLAVNPAIEHKIKEKLAPMVARGVKFQSIFAGVPGSILLDLPPWR